MSANTSLILGVDGGGTKTDACLAQVGPAGEETILGQGQAGSSNVKAVGAEKALANLSQAIDQAWSTAQLPRDCVAGAVFGLSGAGRPETQQLIQNWAREKNIAEQVRVVHDALPVLIAGTPLGHGVALIAGTGAVAFAADRQNNTAVTGGWGYWFGDEGSAFWLGQAAARAVSQATDGRSAPTLLQEALLNRLAIAEPRDLLTSLSHEGDVRTAMAGLADLVSDCAEQGDIIAQGILMQAAEQLADLVISAAQQLKLGNEFPLALAGGVACGSSLLRDGLIKKLNSRRVFPSTVTIVAKPVLGCVRLAGRELGSELGN
ncbi:MAG: BadF/BadG/BcrA/BcrD ATPase family protein [Bythopirellula sp.]|nr:BadF/BadG/BcrA/BcrD ATPase family protein [Bythopirellula sp.]